MKIFVVSKVARWQGEAFQRNDRLELVTLQPCNLSLSVPQYFSQSHKKEYAYAKHFTQRPSYFHQYPQYAH